MTTADTWVFGYGSLVSPASLARTIGRLVDPGDVAVTQLTGYGRRWNYGAAQVVGDWTADGNEVVGGVMVALGLEPSPGESCNGVAVRATEDDLRRLDRRERNYDRTDVTDLVRFDEPVEGVAVAQPGAARVVTYVPRRSAIERYRSGRDEHRAAIRQDYWDLVDEAFAVLGDRHVEQYRTTPAPDIPVVDMQLRLLD